jgi:hypothetical protein
MMAEKHFGSENEIRGFVRNFQNIPTSSSNRERATFSKISENFDRKIKIAPKNSKKREASEPRRAEVTKPPSEPRRPDITKPPSEPRKPEITKPPQEKLTITVNLVKPNPSPSDLNRPQQNSKTVKQFFKPIKQQIIKIFVGYRGHH